MTGQRERETQTEDLRENSWPVSSLQKFQETKTKTEELSRVKGHELFYERQLGITERT